MFFPLSSYSLQVLRRRVINSLCIIVTCAATGRVSVHRARAEAYAMSWLSFIASRLTVSIRACAAATSAIARLAREAVPRTPKHSHIQGLHRNFPQTYPAPFTGKSLTSKPLVQPEPFHSAHQWPICDFSAPKPANPHDTAVRDGVGAAGRLVPHELFCPHIADRAPQACGHKSSCGTRRPAAPPPYIERIFINLYQKNHISATGEHFGKALVVPVVCW